MKLADLSVDDLHVCALGEFAGDDDATATLNAMYADIKEQYIAIFEMLRNREQTS